jgi:hypothetical protein
VRAHAVIGVGGPRTIVSCDVSPPLDLGLSLADRLVMTADDDRRARKLLKGPLEQAVLAAAETTSVLVTDSRIELEVPRLPDERYLVWALEAAAELAEALAVSRRNVPSARSLLPLSPGYRREALALGGTFARTPLGVHTTVEDFAVFVGARRAGALTYEGVAVARFPGSLGLGLTVRGTRLPGQEPDPASVDYLVGDPLFDRVFIVAGDEPIPVLEVLTPELRSLLLAAADAGVVTLTDELVEVRLAAVPAPSSIKRWIETVTKLAALACARLSAETPQRGPYR